MNISAVSGIREGSRQSPATLHRTTGASALLVAIPCVFLAACGAENHDGAGVGDDEGATGDVVMELEAADGQRLTCHGYYYIWSRAARKYVTVEVGGGDHGSMLRARAEQIGPWERFFYCDHPGGGRSLQSALNFGFVSTEIFYPEPFAGMLRARAGGANDWELLDFNISPNTFIYSRANGKFVSAELFGNPYPGLLRARADSPLDWERFSIGLIR